MVETEVLIIGGGPVGLSAALLLAKQGVQSILVEKNQGISTHPKASAFNTRTMEILRELQVADDVYALTGPVGGVSFYTSLTGYKLGEIKMADHPDYIERLIASSPSPLTISSQIVLEKILKQHADESEMVDVWFGHEKISLHQAEGDFDAGYVNAGYVDAEIVELNTGLSSSIRSNYVIACDGAASPTRREFNREMLGAPAFGHQINVYIEADIESLVDTTSHQALFWISTEGVSGVFIGLGGDWKHWCFNFSYFPHKGEKVEDFTAAVCLQKVQAALGTDALPIKILSIGPWVLCGQVIDEYRQGRVFFGGDAAHLNIPTGGFGFNTGMQEIHNLAWKLAYVLRGLAPDELLDSYHSERRDVAVFNVETSRKNAINIRETGAGLGSEIEDADEMEMDSPKGASQRKKHTDAIAHQHNHFIFLGQEIGFGYWDSGLITKDGSAHYIEEHGVEDPIYTYIANARPGARAPHCWVTQKGTLLSLLDLYTTEFTLLIHGDVAAWKETLVDLPDDVPINVYSIGDPDSGAGLIDIHGVWNQYYGIEKAGAVLIRPDGHVTWRAATKADDHDGSSVKTAMMKSLARH